MSLIKTIPIQVTLESLPDNRRIKEMLTLAEKLNQAVPGKPDTNTV